MNKKILSGIVAGAIMLSGSVVAKADDISVYRAYNANNGQHHYTTSYAEYRGLVNLCWRAEGAKFTVLASQANTGIQVYRLYNPNSGEHFFTEDKNEYGAVVSAGWHDEGTAWRGANNGKKLYRLYSGVEHFYTQSKEENDALVALGWTSEASTWTVVE
jgi:hypothetical protein